MPSEHVIYRIDFPSGDFYIGGTGNFAQRRKTHLAAFRKPDRAVSAKLRAAFRAHPICGIYVVSKVPLGVPPHVFEAECLERYQPTLNTVKPTPLPATRHESGGARPWGPYGSIRDAASALGLSYNHAKRISRIPYEEWLYLPNSRPRRKERPKWDPNSQKVLLDNILDFPHNHRRRVGLTLGQYKRRQARGMTLAQIISTPAPKMTRPRYITANGETLTLKVWAQRSGLKIGTIAYRIDRLGWTPEEAVGLAARASADPTQRKGIPKYTAHGHTRTLTEWALALDVTKTTLDHRLKIGYPLEQVFGPRLPAGRPPKAM